MTEIERQIAEGLSRYADYPLAAMGPDTRIWHDARISGDDFAEFIGWLWSAFDVVLPGEAKDYAPGEPHIFDDMWRFFRKPPQYRELRIADLARLAEKYPTSA